MNSNPYLVDDSDFLVADTGESLEPALAFDWANLIDNGILGFSEAQNAWFVTAAQFNLASLQMYKQTLWFVPGMFLFDAIGQGFASLLEAQTAMLRLLTQQTRIAAEMQAEFATAPVEAAADAFRRALDLLAGDTYAELPEAGETKELTAAAA